MIHSTAVAAPFSVALPRIGALAVGARIAAWLSPDGEIEEMPLVDAALRVSNGAIVCHARATARRLGIDGFPAFDLLDLFAFVHPARFCLPTVRGVARELGLPEPRGLADECVAIHEIAESLLIDLAR
jgi:ATP-dependent DNA helicase DinG